MNIRSKIDTSEIFGIFILMTSFVTAAGFGVTAIYHFFPHHPVLAPEFASALIAQSVHPKPLERLIYITLAAIVPFVLLFGSGFLSSLKLSSPSVSPTRHVFMNAALVTLVPLLFILPFFNLELSRVLFRLHAHMIGTLLLGGSMVLLCICFYQRKCKINASIKKYIIWIFPLTIFFLSLISFRIFNENAVSFGINFNVHLDPIMYVLNQVQFGKTLLVNLPSQYGLFEEFLVPIFKVIPLSILNVTIVFSCLELLAFCALIFILKQYIRNDAVIILCALSIVLTTGNVFLYLLPAESEPYFQYFPVRFLWPAVSAAVFSIYSRRPSLPGLVLFSILAGIACLWNLDSGIPIAISFMAFLVARLGFLSATQVRQHSATHLVTYAAIIVAVCGGFFAWLSFKSGSSLNFSWLWAYQKFFWQTGFFMIPLPVPFHPWMSVLGIYLMGLIVAVLSWRKGLDSKFPDMIFFLSLLGIGLFSYYSGRSHIYNLVTILWPALVVGAMLVDRVLRCIKVGLASKYMALATVPYLLFISLCAISLVSGIPFLLTGAKNTLQTLHASQDPSHAIVSDEISFMKNNLHGRECLILSMRQGIYYTQLGYASPLDGPSLIETFLRHDLDSLMNKATDGSIPCIFLGTGDHSRPSFLFKIPIKSFLKRYKISAHNPDQSMILLEPINAATR